MRFRESVPGVGSIHQALWGEKYGIRYPIPLEVSIEVTWNCPFRCIMCSSNTKWVWGRGSLEGELSTHSLFNTVDEIHELGASVISWSGGEPLLKEHFTELLKYSKQKGIQNWVYTCGGVWGCEVNSIDMASYDYLCEVVKYSDKIILNIQGHTKELVDYVMGIEGAFLIVSKCLDTLKSCGEKWIEAHFIPMRINSKYIESTVKFLLDKKEISRVSFLRFVPQGRGEANKFLLALTTSELLEVNKVLRKLQKEYGKERIRIGRPLNFSFLIDPAEKPYSCRAGLDAPLIQPLGRIDACPAWKMLPEKYALGWLSEDGKGLLQAWIHGRVVNELRKINTAAPEDLRSILQGECLDCRFFPLCRGRCIAQRIRHWGNPYQTPDPMCPLIGLHAEGHSTEG